MLIAAIGLLRSDMADLHDAWSAGQAAKAEGWPLDPLHDATVYASLVLLGMHGLSELARLCVAEEGNTAASSSAQSAGVRLSRRVIGGDGGAPSGFPAPDIWTEL
jgi:hypothetical protein